MLHYRQLIRLFFLVIFIKAISWSFLVPLWHFPDEQAHFGHVAFIAEGGDLARHGRYPDMNEEIYTSLEILGTKRDEQGNNKFTYHPEYRLDYSNTITGPREEEIKNLPQSMRQNLVIAESAYYPHLYYQISAQIYKLFYSADLFVRVFAVRTFWLMAHLLMIWLIYKSAKIIWPQKLLNQLAVITMVAFQPMLTFVSSGVTSDNLHNLLFTAVIYFCLDMIKKPRLQNFLGLTLVLGLGIINKQQFLVAFVVALPVLAWILIRDLKKIWRYYLILPLFGVVAFIFAPERSKSLMEVLLSGQLPYLTIKTASQAARPDYSLSDHLIWTIKHTIREVIPWYWGVFNWLGVVLPRLVNRILNRLMIVAGLGLIVKLIQIIRNRKLTKTEIYLSFITWAALAYFAALTIWDWSFIRNSNYSFGIQGRYHFPVIAAHMMLLFVGFDTLVGVFSKRFKFLANKLLVLWFLILNWIGLYTVAKAYYQLSNLKVFIIQASQYKPFFAKGPWLTAFLLAYLIASVLYIFNLLKNNHEK